MFPVTEDQLGSAVARLVFHGVDTFARVMLNGNMLDLTNNMFVRYVYDVKQHLKVKYVLYSDF